MKNNFVAIDFETSCGHIPCSIGLVEFIDGKVVNEYYTLIKPIDLKFNPVNSRINGIYLEDVFNEREFDEIWEEIEHFFIDRVVVAHNLSFDISVLEKTLNHYKIHKPDYETYCTLSISQSILDVENHKLSTLANHFEIKQENYHNALEDAFVCGKIFIEMFYDNNVISSVNSVKQSKIINRNYGQYLQAKGQSKMENPYVWNLLTNSQVKFLWFQVFLKNSQEMI